MTQSFNIGVSGAWKAAKPYVGVSGTWKPIQAGWVGVGGVWKQVYAGIFVVLPDNVGWTPHQTGETEPKTGAPLYDGFEATISASSFGGGTAPYTFDFHDGLGFTSSPSRGYLDPTGLITAVSCTVRDATGLAAESNVCTIF
jgi:hypothetical protein